MKEAVNKKGHIMKIYRLKPLSVCETNSYIVASEENNCVLIDAPADPDYILGEIESHGLTLKKIFLTHGHFDHIGAVADLVDRTGCEVYIHIMDKPKLTDDAGMLANLFKLIEDRLLGYSSFVCNIALFFAAKISALHGFKYLRLVHALTEHIIHTLHRSYSRYNAPFRHNACYLALYPRFF